MLPKSYSSRYQGHHISLHSPLNSPLAQNMVALSDVDDDLEGEIREEMTKYGHLNSVVIHKVHRDSPNRTYSNSLLILPHLCPYLDAYPHARRGNCSHFPRVHQHSPGDEGSSGPKPTILRWPSYSRNVLPIGRFLFQSL